MQPLPTQKQAQQTLLRDAKDIQRSLKALLSTEPTDLSSAVELLTMVRSAAAEALNQIPHADLALRTAAHLAPSLQNASWEWNPRSTGTIDEPDLRAIVEGRTAIAAEVTASPVPKGEIDTRMSRTLRKLASIEARDRYYVVTTEQMQRRAVGKVKKADYQISVLLLGSTKIEVTRAKREVPAQRMSSHEPGKSRA